MSEYKSTMIKYDNDSSNNHHGTQTSNGTHRKSDNQKRLEVRFLVCSRDAGAIIGKKGANIQALRQKHKVVIQVPDCDGPERVLSLQGEYEACLAAIVDILPTMKDNQRVQNDQNEIRLLTHQSQAGAVIGKGGERVRELRTKFNVGMKVFVQCLPFSTERVAALRGRAEDIERCLREIFGILEQTPPRGQTCFYDPYNFDASLSAEYGGFADTQHATQTSQPNSRPSRDPNDFPPPSSSFPPPYFHENSNQHSSSASRPVISGHESNYGVPQAPQSATQTTQVTIPNNFASAIIGVRGTKIAQIRQTSGATIRIDDPTPSSSDRIITIQGTSSQIGHAQYLLQMAVKESGLWNGN